MLERVGTRRKRVKRDRPSEECGDRVRVGRGKRAEGQGRGHVEGEGEVTSRRSILTHTTPPRAATR